MPLTDAFFHPIKTAAEIFFPLHYNTAKYKELMQINIIFYVAIEFTWDDTLYLQAFILVWDDCM